MLKIGNLELKYPIFQGGMAMKVSTAKLAASVANEGGLGIIGASAMTGNELREEIRKAKALLVNNIGGIGVNIMAATSTFSDLLKISIEEKIDAIVFGAGFLRDVFETGIKANIPVIPIVSSLKLAKIAQKLKASAIIVEGGNAGGHIGAETSSWDLMKEIKPFMTIPVIGAGGIITPEDGKKMLDLGADGIQMGTRFLASHECEVDDYFKQLYVNSKKEDVVRMMSPAGLPANALRTAFVEKILQSDFSEVVTGCNNCMTKCRRNFCIRQKLLNALTGDPENSVFFAGEDVYRINTILSVKEIFSQFKPIFE